MGFEPPSVAKRLAAIAALELFLLQNSLLLLLENLFQLSRTFLVSGFEVGLEPATVAKILVAVSALELFWQDLTPRSLIDN